MLERIKFQSFPSSQLLEMMIILYQRRPKPKAKAKIGRGRVMRRLERLIVLYPNDADWDSTFAWNLVSCEDLSSREVKEVRSI